MARGIGWLALAVAYLATLFYIAAMVTPWWYTKYYPVNSTDEAFYDANPSIDQHTGLFDMTNCFIDGSCITGGQIYKNNSTLQWVYTAILVLMIVGWIPWLIFVHLLHYRNSSNPDRANMRGLRVLMFLSALAAFFLVLAAFIVFATGMVKTNGVYNSGGLYGHKSLLSQNGWIGTGANIDDSQNNKRSDLMIGYEKRTGNMNTGATGGTGGTGSANTNGGSSPTNQGPASSQSGSPAATGSGSDTQTGTGAGSQTGTGVTPPLGESGTASTTASCDSTVSSSTGAPMTTSTTVVAPTEDGGNGLIGSAGIFGYTGAQDARNLNLYSEPYAWGTLPYGNQGYNLLGAGVPVLYNVSSLDQLNGTIGYKYGAHAAWYFALLTLALIPLAFLLALCIKPAKTVVTQTRTTTTTTTTAAVIPPVVNRVQ